MDTAQRAFELKATGHFKDALRVLDSVASVGERRPLQVMKAELLELVGNLSLAQSLAQRLLKTSKLTPSERASCETVIARVLLENGEVDEATQFFQRAISQSSKAGDLKQLCWIQSKLVTVLAERAGRDAAAPL